MIKCSKISTIGLMSCISMHIVGMQLPAHHQQTNEYLRCATTIMTATLLTNPQSHKNVEYALCLDNRQPQQKPTQNKNVRHKHNHKAIQSIIHLRKQSQGNVHQPDKNGKRVFPGKNAKK